jgi:purine nucleosidase
VLTARDLLQVDVILDLLRTHEDGEITILTIGPLTNIALAVEADIATLRRVKEIVIMGGAFFKAGNVTSHAEYNMCDSPVPPPLPLLRSDPCVCVCVCVCVCTCVYVRAHSYADPEAAKVVCESQLPLVFVPLDATHCVPYGETSHPPLWTRPYLTLVGVSCPGSRRRS